MGSWGVGPGRKLRQTPVPLPLQSGSGARRCHERRDDSAGYGSVWLERRKGFAWGWNEVADRQRHHDLKAPSPCGERLREVAEVCAGEMPAWR